MCPLFGTRNTLKHSVELNFLKTFSKNGLNRTSFDRLNSPIKNNRLIFEIKIYLAHLQHFAVMDSRIKFVDFIKAVDFVEFINFRIISTLNKRMKRSLRKKRDQRIEIDRVDKIDKFGLKVLVVHNS